MKFIKKIISSSNFWPIVIIIFFGLLSAKGLFGQGYFNMHDDLQMMRQLEMEKCFLTLQIPCRWVPDMGYGFGFPLFNFYPPLPYLFGEIIRIFGVAFTDTIKISFMFAFVASGISMYFLVKELFGKYGAVLSAIFYIWAPYHSVDIYVRGAMNEAWGIIWFPVILLFGYKLITQKFKIRNLIILTLGWVGLLLSHNLMALIFAPVFAGWCLLWIVKFRNWKFSTLHLALSGILALCLSAFFTLPVIVEQKLVQTGNLIQGYYDYSGHFATIKQLLFSRFWGYGPSVWGPNDGLSFQVGYLHWILPLVVGLLVLYQFIKTKKIPPLLLTTSYFILVGWFAVFMVHNKSTFIWLHIPQLLFVQFPWRFLTLAILAFSFVIGAIPRLISKRFIYWITALLTIGLLVSNWNYFLPEFGHLRALTDQQKFTGAAWDLQRGAGIYDYLPLTAKNAPQSPMMNFVEILNGQARASNLKLGTNNNSFDIIVVQTAEVRLGLFEFPNWRITLNGKEIPSFVPSSEEFGMMHITIPVGQFHVNIKLYNTPIRTASNIISLVSWLGLGGYLARRAKLRLSMEYLRHKKNKQSN